MVSDSHVLSSFAYNYDKAEYCNIQNHVKKIRNSYAV